MLLPFRQPKQCQEFSPPAAGGKKRSRREDAFILTFWEVLISVVIVALVFGSIINGYLATGLRVEWTGYSLAAQSLGIQTLEKARSATWDTSIGKNELTNMPLLSQSWNSTTLTYSGYTTNLLDLPYKGTNYVIATNYVTIQWLNIATGYTNELQVVRVDTVWRFTGWGNYNQRFFTNSICTYIAPDNRDPESLGAVPETPVP